MMQEPQFNQDREPDKDERVRPRKRMKASAVGAQNEKPSAHDTDLLPALRRLYRHLSTRRRVQLVLLLAFMLVGALAELMTIGAVLPFLALMVDPGRAADMPLLGSLFTKLGWHNKDILVPATLLFIIFAVLSGAIRLALAWLSQKYVFRLGHDLCVEVYKRTLYQPYSYHTSKNSSEFISDIYKAQGVVNSMMLSLMQALIAVVISAFILAALLAVNTRVALITAFGFGALYLGISLATRKRLRVNSRIIAKAQTQWVKIVQEGLGGIRDVLINHTQKIYLRAYEQTDLLYRDAQSMNGFIGAAPRFIIEGAGMVLIALLALALAQGEGGLATALPVLGALALGASRLLPLVQVMYVGWAQISSNRHILSDVLDVLDLPLPAQADHRQDARSPLPFAHTITLEAVGFRYQAHRPAVLTDIDLTIDKGSRIGIVGKTGSGKTTLVDLLMGLLTPTTGVIRIDGTPLSLSNMGRWQARIAHVPQAIYLSDASIGENIAFGVPPTQIDHMRLVAAARQAAIADFIESLPDGYDTFVGERGVRLSGGQRQRIGIARALYRQADVLVFDEATSALDTETETAVMDAVTRLGRDLTIFIIAHRLSTLEGCDFIVQLEGGGMNIRKPRLAHAALPHADRHAASTKSVAPEGADEPGTHPSVAHKAH